MPDHARKEFFERTLVIVNGSTIILVSNYVYFHLVSLQDQKFDFFYSCKSVLEMDGHGKQINCL